MCQWTGSTLVQVMACWLTAPSHYLKQCWRIISKVLWHSPEDITLRISKHTISESNKNMDSLKSHLDLPWDNELKIRHLPEGNTPTWKDGLYNEASPMFHDYKSFYSWWHLCRKQIYFLISTNLYLPMTSRAHLMRIHPLTLISQIFHVVYEKDASATLIIFNTT